MGFLHRPVYNESRAFGLGTRLSYGWGLNRSNSVGFSNEFEMSIVEVFGWDQISNSWSEWDHFSY